MQLRKVWRRIKKLQNWKGFLWQRARSLGRSKGINPTFFSAPRQQVFFFSFGIVAAEYDTNGISCSLFLPDIVNVYLRIPADSANYICFSFTSPLMEKANKFIKITVQSCQMKPPRNYVLTKMWEIFQLFPGNPGSHAAK